MGVTGRLLRAASRRPHVLVAAVPGATAVRLAVEAHLARRDWPMAWSPADADLLVVCGARPAALQAPVEELWSEMPEPRARSVVVAPVLAPGALDAARARLLAPGRVQNARSMRRAGHHPATPGLDPQAHEAPGTGSHGGGDAGEDASGGDHDHGGHAHMREEMSMPGGLAMAERGDDRDGLKLDQLHVALGPLLAAWPAGLVLRVTLQGDVIQWASAELVGADGRGSFWLEPATRASYGEAVTVGEAARRTAGCHLDRLGRFLAVAGWPDASNRACWLRDDVLGGAPCQQLSGRFGALARLVGRSRTLRWMTAGLGMLSSADAAALGVTGPAARAGGDVTARYQQWLTETAEVLELLGNQTLITALRADQPLRHLHDAVVPAEPLLAAVEGLVVGCEIGAARLVVASFDPDVDELGYQPAGAAGG